MAKKTIGVCGSLGCVGSAVKSGLERLGHKVIGHDIRAGTSIEDLLETDVVFICVPTPADKETGKCDTSIVENVVKELDSLHYKGVIAIKSTVAPTTTDKLQKRYPALEICFVPEFLRERSAFSDFIENHNVCVVGAHANRTYELIKEIHGHYPKSFVKLKPIEAELVKYYHNVFNALRVVWANNFYELATALGADYTAVKNAAAKQGAFLDMYMDCNENFRGYTGLCVVEGTKVYTSNGLIPIEKIKIGDYVLTIDGSYQQVKETFVREVNEDLVKITPQGMKSSILTKEHPVYAQHTNRGYFTVNGKPKFSNALVDKLELDWIDAGELRKGDYVCIPTPKEWNTETGEITPEIARLLGYYTAEGNLEKKCNRISFSFHSNETIYHDDVEKIAKKELGVQNISKIIDGNKCVIRFASSKFKELADKHCGQHSWKKKMSTELLTSNKEVLREFLIGYFRGDGSKSTDVYTVATVSPELADNLKFIYNKFGIGYSFKVSKAHTGKDGTSHREAYYISVKNKLDIEKFGELINDKISRINKTRKTSWFEEDKQILPIKTIEYVKYSGKVYNLEVDSNHTYVIEDMLVHNCLPKDSKALRSLASELGLKGKLFDTIVEDNKLWRADIIGNMRRE